MNELRRAGRRWGRGVLVLIAVTVLVGHVGTNSVSFRGEAGPYPVSVVVRMPDAVPGLAQITIRVLSGDVDEVTVQPSRWDAPPGAGAPPPDVAERVPSLTPEDHLYAAEVWLMTEGTYRLVVAVTGTEGSGSVAVPVNSVIRSVNDMPAALVAILVGLGVLLFAGAVGIAGAAVREGTLAGANPPDRRRVTRGRWAMVGGGIVVAVVAYLGLNWWEAIDRDVRSGIFRPLAVEGVVELGEVNPTDQSQIPYLRLSITDDRWLGPEWTPLVPDHGKLMHMFVVGAPDLTSFAHIHPVPVDSATFVAPWPDLPAGEYRIYGDIVDESGYAQTLVDTITVEAGVDGSLASFQADPDDSWWNGTVHTPGERAEFEDGLTISWTGPTSFRVDEEALISFSVQGDEGEAAALELYMGMMGHAAVTRADGAVFAHLHPAGSISMGSLGVLERRAGGEVATPAPAMGTGEGIVSFPFVFPRPGEYTVWVQIKSAGQVRTAAFRPHVEE